MPSLGQKPQDFYHHLYAESRSIVDASSISKPGQLHLLSDQLQTLSATGAHFTLLKRASLQVSQLHGDGLEVIDLMEQDEERIQRETAAHLRRMVRKQTWKFAEIFCIAPNNALPKKRGRSALDATRLIKLLTLEGGQKILEGKDTSIQSLSRELRRKIALIVRLLPQIGKIALVPHDGMQEEVESIEGSGTLFIDPKQTECRPIEANERGIVEAVHEHYTKLGMFRRRSREELATLMEHQRILRIQRSPLGGGSLLPIADTPNALMLEGLWAHPLGNGLGRILMERLLIAAEAKRIFTLTTNSDAMKLFASTGFADHGAVSKLTDTSNLPAHICTYSKTHPNRDPHLFIRTPRA